MKDLGPCNRYEGGVCTKKVEGIPIIEKREAEGAQVH